MLLLDFKDVLCESVDPIQFVELLIAVVLPEFIFEIFPFHIIRYIVFDQELSKILDISLFSNPSLFFLFVVQFVHVVLESVLFVVTFKYSPSRICDEIILNLVHFAIGCEIFVLSQHFYKLNPIGLSLGLLLQFIDLLQLCNVLKKIFFFIANF